MRFDNWPLGASAVVPFAGRLLFCTTEMFLSVGRRLRPLKYPRAKKAKSPSQQFCCFCNGGLKPWVGLSTTTPVVLPSFLHPFTSAIERAPISHLARRSEFIGKGTLWAAVASLYY